MIDFSAICQSFNLGHIENFTKAPGGLLHDLWKLNTNVGQFAVKKMNQQNLKLLQHNLLNPTQSQIIALEMQQSGVTTIVALKSSQNKYLEVIADQDIMVFPWVDGRCLFSDDITLKMTQQIGVVLAKIHKAHLATTGLNNSNWFGFSESHWQKLINPLSQEKQLILKEVLSDIFRWNNFARSTRKQGLEKQVVSHRDFDPKNVLWNSNHEPILIDWEYAGLINPVLDLFIVSLNWSFTAGGQIDRPKFNSIWQSYENERETQIALPPSILNGYFGYCLDWLEFNIKRCGMTECEVSWREVLNTIAALKSVENSFLTAISSAWREKGKKML